jgi:hypothetical protein
MSGSDVEPVTNLPWVKSTLDGQEHVFPSTEDGQAPRALCGHLTVAHSPPGQAPGPRCWKCLQLRVVQ